MGLFLCLNVASFIIVTAAILEVPSECTFEDFVKSKRLTFNKIGILKFTVDNPDTTALDALQGSKAVYKTSTDDTFSIRVQCYVPRQLCFDVRGVEEVTFRVTIFEGNETFTEQHELTDSSIWSTICWSHPTGPVRLLQITPHVAEELAEVKGLSMKYCRRKGPTPAPPEDDDIDMAINHALN